MGSEPIAATAAGYFGSLVESYDSLIRRAVPVYREMTSRLVDALPARARRVLELGCGTGNLSVALAARFPDAAITFVDAAPEMIEVTRRRIDRLAPRVAARATFVTARFEDLELLHAARGDVDLAVSCISLHHVVDKQALYRGLAGAIAPGGALRFADQIRGATDATHEANWNAWLAFCRAPGNCTEAEIASLVAHAEAHDHYVPLEEHFTMLRAAGFTHPDCIWRHLMWGIVTAARPQADAVADTDAVALATGSAWTAGTSRAPSATGNGAPPRRSPAP
jgi:ubiquinone/menaquinone biosynthesis C-methylase UbiE